MKSIKEYIIKAKDTLKGLRFIDNRVEVFLHILGLSNKDFTEYKLRNGIKLVLPNGLKNRTALITINEIFCDNIYNAPYANGKTVIDIGANIGVFSLYAFSKNKGMKIYAFEPDEENFSQLSRNIKKMMEM